MGRLKLKLNDEFCSTRVSAIFDENREKILDEKLEKEEEHRMRKKR